MSLNIRVAVALALSSLAVGSALAQPSQAPNGGVPVGQPSSPAAAGPGAQGLAQGGLAGLPPGAQPAPMVGTPLPSAQQAPQSLPPLPAGVAQGTAQQESPNFEDLMAQKLGLTPAQIRELRHQQNLRQRASSELPVTPPKQVLSSVSASPSPGSTPPVIRLFSGYASALTFVDSTGALWPIENYAVGSDKKLDVKRLDSEKGSILSVAPMVFYDQTNLLVFLRGLSSPIVLSFVTGQKAVDLRTEVRVQGLGPNAQVTVGGLPASTNPSLYSLLEGVPPSDAKELRVRGGDGRAWLSKTGRLYLRTSMKVISPSWIGSARSADGMGAYEMMPANSIRVLRDGQIATVELEGW